MTTAPIRIDALALELGFEDRDIPGLIRFIRDIRDDREMRPRLKSVKRDTLLTARQADWIRELDRQGREG